MGRQRVQVGHGSHRPHPTLPFVLFKDELVFCLDSVLLGLRNTHYLDLLSTWPQGGLPVRLCGTFCSTPTHSDPLGLALSLEDLLKAMFTKAEGRVRVFAPKQRGLTWRMYFLLRKTLERTHFLWNWCWEVEERSNACMFFSFLQTFQPRRGGCTEKPSLSCPPPHPLPPAGLSQLQPSLVATAGENRKPQLCGTKRACIMFTQ